MSHYRITKEEILTATNGGLDIILSYYPDASECIDKKGKKFKMRDEKTPSAAIKRLPDGNYVVADFGDDGKWLNGIMLCMKEEGIDFGGAIKFLAAKFGIGSDEGIKSMFEPIFEVADATPDQKEGEKEINDVYEEIPESSLNILFSEKVFSAIEFQFQSIADEKKRSEAVYNHLRKVCTKLHWFALKSYTIIKNRKAIKIGATEYYPIFLIHEQKFQKIYQPKADNKGHRFMYIGAFDQNFIHGHDQAIQAYNDLNKSKEVDAPDPTAENDSSETEKLRKHPELIYCTGGSDALNIAALGYQVVWPSSEYYKLGAGKVKEFLRISENFMTCPDLDITGQKQNHRLCMDPRDHVFLEIKTIVLPDELKKRRDFRGNSCKDVRDYLRFYTKKAFAGLVETAIPYRFWDLEIGRTSKGDVKMKYGRPVYEYKPNNVRMYQFLKNNGFHRYKFDDNHECVYIHIVDNRVRQVKPVDIKNYINNFLEERQFSEDLRNSFHRSNQLSETSLSSLKEIEIDFSDNDEHSQYFFFENATWKVSKTGLESFKPGDVSKFVWDDEVIRHKAKKLDEPFTITYNQVSGEYDIVIHDDSCIFLKYLVNASRIHWRKELEESLKDKTETEQEEYKEKNRFNIAGPNLTQEEIRDQKLHLVNKIYCLGYLLHRYKDPSRSWCVFAMDNKISDDGLSHGGSGKSIALKSIRYLMNSVTFDGRNNKLFDNDHVYDRVTKYTDYMLFDDASKNFQFDRLFAVITGVMVVNPKGTASIEMSESDIPKTAISTNFTPNEISPTTLRRLLFTVFSDYYHFENNGEYNETRDPKSDFGKTLFFQFDEKEWNLFYNTMAACCRWYMNFEKIEPPMGNVMIRNLQNFMGQAFLRWADVYFSEEGSRRDAYVIKRIALEDFLRETKLTGWSTQAFTSRLVAWCRYKNLILDPAELQNKEGRLIKNVPDYHWDQREKSWIKSNTKKTSEMIYIQTPGEIISSRIIDPSTNVDQPQETPSGEDDMKF